MSNKADRDDAHLQDVDDGCGCAEVWEALSEHRSEREDTDAGEGAAVAEGDAAVHDGAAGDAAVRDAAVTEVAEVAED